MKILTANDIPTAADSLELARNERVSVKRWLTAFFDIPAEFRVNPFDVSPSVDLSD
jgi:hypothetical protein